MQNRYIGVTACDECGTRFKVVEQHRKKIGKPARCPNCRNVFTVELVEPTPLEQAAISDSSQADNSQSDDTVAPKKCRRSRSEIRQEYINSIRQGFIEMHPRLVSIDEAQRSSEEQVRVWVIDALADVLGYKRTEEIDTEVRALGQRVDVVLKQGDHIFMVIECKNIRSKLSNKVRDQAVAYATSLSAEWAVTTNGRDWKLYQVAPQPGREPKITEIFDVSLLDEDGVSDLDAESLYLLTARAVFKGDLEKMSHFIGCTSKKRILKALGSDRVVKALRLELASSYLEECGQRVNIRDEDAGTVLEEALGLSEL